MMQGVIFRVFPKLQLVWFFLLPWAGYAAALWVAPDVDPLRSTILLGWCTLFIYQFTKLGIVQMELSLPQESLNWKSMLLLLAPLVPSGSIGLNQSLLGGDWSSYFLEQFTMEVVALVLAVSGTLLFAKNQKGRTGWQDLGPIPLLFSLFVLAGIWGVVDTWWSGNEEAHASTRSLVLLAVALGMEFRQQWRVLGRILRREMIIQDFVEGNKGMFVILGQLVLWLALPAIRYL